MDPPTLADPLQCLKPKIIIRRIAMHHLKMVLSADAVSSTIVAGIEAEVPGRNRRGCRI